MFIKKYLLFIILITPCIVLGSEVLSSFSSGGGPVYHLKPATVDDSGKRAVISADYSGFVNCHYQDGGFLWRSKVCEGFPFDLEVCDIDGDGLDESLIASGDGNLYALDAGGHLLWVFRTGPPLYQVDVATYSNGSKVIITGGVERILYLLSPDGMKINSVEAAAAIRLIGSGDIMGDGNDYIGIASARTSLSGKYALQLFDLRDLTQLWSIDMPLIKMGTNKIGTRRRYNSIEVFDLDKDGKEELVFGHSCGGSGELTVYNHKGEVKLLVSDREVALLPYAMNLITHVKSPTLDDEYILSLFANLLIVFNLGGTCRDILKGPYSFANGAFDPQTYNYLLGSGISGGNGIYVLNLKNDNWMEVYEDIEPVGRMAELESNMEILTQQVSKFKKPDYQGKTKKSLIILDETWKDIESNYLENGDYSQVQFATHHVLSEDYDRSILKGIWINKRQWKMNYDLTSKEIVNYALQMENKGHNFMLWAGHGGDPFFMRLETMEGVLEAAPNTFKVFEFAELEKIGEDYEYARKEHLLPLGELCLKHGNRKILLRHKNIFWNLTFYKTIWPEVLRDKRYGKIYVPCMEETNSRTQGLSLAGRVGVWLSGYFDRLSGRAVMDNLVYNRLWEWCHAQYMNHHIRAMSLARTLGSDMFYISKYTGGGVNKGITIEGSDELIIKSTGQKSDMSLFYMMLEKGVLTLPEKREDVLSISNVCLGINNPSEEYIIKHGKNTMDIDGYYPTEKSFVFDRLDCYWGGAPVPPHDFTNIALGVDRRMHNFLPRTPYGLVTTVPDNIDMNEFTYFKEKITTDGQYYYDEDGNKHSAIEYRPQVIAKLKESAARLPIRVSGDVAWSAVRLDSTHVRVTLIDPGYVNPSERKAVIHLQHLKGIKAHDILRDKDLDIVDDKIKLTVPLGILRIVDITHSY